MKITETTRFYAGVTTEQNTEKADSQFGKRRMYAGGIDVQQNPLDAQIEEKRATAMEKAKKLLSDVFAAEKSVDDD